MRARTVLLVAGLFSSTFEIASAQSVRSTTDAASIETRLNAIAESYTKDHAFMGSVLVAEGDRVLLNKGYGMADIEWQIPNEPDVKFRIGSVTKQFTATLILLLQQDGKLRVEDPVRKYLPDAPRTWDKITLAHLLGHTSGIPDFTSNSEFKTWAMSQHTPSELLSFFQDKPLRFEPGERFSYSNSNYEVLGVVAETVSGIKYGDLLRQRIFESVGMRNTGLDYDGLILPRRAQGYRVGPQGLEIARSESMSVPWAAGSIYSTTGDLLLWEHALFGGKVLNQDSLKAMTTAGKGKYGFGVFIDEETGDHLIAHGGDIEGFNATLSYVPAHELVVVVLGNVNGDAPSSIGKQLRDVVLGKPVILRSEHGTVPHL